MDSRQTYIDDLQNAWRHDDEHPIVPDGGRITVAMTMMDSAQRAAQSHQMDAQPAALEPDKQQALDMAKRHQDRVQGFADHFTRERNLRTLTERPATAYDQHCYQLSNAWRTSV